MGAVVPLLLAAHGFRTALLDVFEGADLPLTATRGIRCLAVACVHHDAGKMGECERRLGRPTEPFFTGRPAQRGIGRRGAVDGARDGTWWCRDAGRRRIFGRKPWSRRSRRGKWRVEDHRAVLIGFAGV